MKTKLMRRKKSQSGQTALEYVLMLATVVGFFMLVARGIGSWGLQQKMLAPLNDKFAKVYKNGRVDAMGYDELTGGGPTNHPRARSSRGTGNFRIFLNPRPK